MRRPITLGSAAVGAEKDLATTLRSRMKPGESLPLFGTLQIRKSAGDGRMEREPDLA